MTCSLQPECNFLHWYFRCQLLVEVVDIDLKITSRQGMHIFQRDKTTQLIKCTPWNTRICSHPTIIKKMKTFLEVEGKMGPIPQPTCNKYRPLQPDANPNVRKDKRKRTALTKGLGLAQPPSLVKQPNTHLLLFPGPQSMLNPKQMLLKIGPHP